MNNKSSWLDDHGLWLEVFVLFNLAGLSLDIYIAHSVNRFHHPAEYVPLYFSLVAPAVLACGLMARHWPRTQVAWRDFGYLVGWLSVIIGVAGMLLHLDSRFFYERTIESLIYAAPFAAPLSYAGLGLLLILNRMVDQGNQEWALWVILMALGGFVGNFIFALTDHAQNGFFHSSEWIPVVSSALAVGVLAAPFLTPIGPKYLWLCAAVLLLQALVGVLGLALHLAADRPHGNTTLLETLIHGAPPMAPLLFCDLGLLAGIGLWCLGKHLPSTSLEHSAGAERATSAT